jgi:hypothetical protein
MDKTSLDKTWSDIAGTFAEAGLTTVGSLLGGPLGGAIGGMLGQAAAAALGVERTPAAVAAEIERDPVGAAEKLQNMESEAIALAEIEARQVAEVNATLRAELAATTGGTFRAGWRPFCGWALGGLSAAYGGAVVGVAARVALASPGATEALTVLLNGVGPFTLFLAPLGAVAGVTAWTRGREKEAALTALPGAVLGTVVGQAAGAAIRKAVR